MKKATLLVALALFNLYFVEAQKDPSFEEVISLQAVSNAIISPSGDAVLFTSQTVDWKENRYDTELYLSKDGQAPFQLTNNLKGSSSTPKWSPDGRWIAYLLKH